MSIRPNLSHWPADTSRKILNLTAGELLRQAAAEEPDRIALVEVAPLGPALVPGSGDRTWSYRELLAEAETAAQWLLTQFEPGERVLVWAPNIPEWVILQYGTALAGLVLVTANPALRDSELEYVVRQSGAAGIAYVDNFRGTDMAAIVAEIAPRLPKLRVQIRFNAWDTEVRSYAGPPVPLPTVSPQGPAQVQYTSGTTGAPKGALLRHQALITNASFVHQRAQFPIHGVWTTALPLFHTAGCAMSVLGTATSRGTLVLAQVFDPAMVLEAAQRYRTDLIGGVPTMLAALLGNPDFDTYDLSSVRVVVSGGDAVPIELAQQVERRIGARITTVYGQTELSPIVAQTSPDDAPDDKTGTVGQPLWQVEVKIVDPLTRDVTPIGEPGEICARGYQSMIEYLDNPDETAKTIDADGWLHTGDLGTLDERGYLRVTGRLKDMIIRGGENIYPREIESVLLQHPAVANAIVVGIPDEHWGEVVAAIIQPAAGVDVPGAEEMHRFVRTMLAPHKTPSSWYRADSFPANAMGKLQKFVLRKQIQNAELPALDPGSEVSGS